MNSRFTEEWLADRLAKNAMQQNRIRGDLSLSHQGEGDTTKTGRTYSFTVFGEPQPAGSKQAFPLLDKKHICKCGSIAGLLPLRRENGSIIVNVTDDNKDTKAWRKHVSQTAREEYSGPLLTGFVSLGCVFYLLRPKGHYGSGSNERRLKPSAPAFPGVKPDLDKLMRAVGDGLTQAKNVYTDDAQIVDGGQKKRYGSPPRVEITVSELIVPEPYE